MEIAFFGSSLLSAYWNGAATYYRGIVRGLALRGHHITFYEPDALDRQARRDIRPPGWARSVVYDATEEGVEAALEHAARADVLVKASGVGVFDDLLERGVLEAGRSVQSVIFWDVDAPATLERITAEKDDPFRPLIPRYDMILTYGGGPPVVDAYLGFGASACVPIYNAVDVATHYPVQPELRFSADMTFIGNRLPDREARVDEFLIGAATRLPRRDFLLGGSGWEDKELPYNVRPLGHVPTTDHNAINCSARAILNVNRASMARFGYSPPTRIFEAAGVGACVITDAWAGIELFLEPGEEVLVAADGEGVAAALDELTEERAALIGRAARRRLLREHTYAHRALDVESILLGRTRGAKPTAP